MFEYLVIPILKLRPLEKVFPCHLQNLRKKILSDGMMKQSIIVDKETNIILDGSHRYVFLLMEGFSLAPVIPVDYKNQYISVGTSRTHRFIVDNPSNISKKEVIRRGLSGDVYPPRTTRHFFPFLKKEVNTSLSDLNQKDIPFPFQHLVADVGVTEEIAHNIKYLKEIDDELVLAINYLYTAQNVKKYLQFQIEEMRKEPK